HTCEALTPCPSPSRAESGQWPGKGKLRSPHRRTRAVDSATTESSVTLLCKDSRRFLGRLYSMLQHNLCGTSHISQAIEIEILVEVQTEQVRCLRVWNRGLQQKAQAGHALVYNNFREQLRLERRSNESYGLISPPPHLQA